MLFTTPLLPWRAKVFPDFVCPLEVVNDVCMMGPKLVHHRTLGLGISLDPFLDFQAFPLVLAEVWILLSEVCAQVNCGLELGLLACRWHVALRSHYCRCLYRNSKRGAEGAFEYLNSSFLPGVWGKQYLLRPFI